VSAPGRPCARVREQLPLFVGGDLPDETARAVREHLLRCASCRVLASDHLQAVRTLHRAGEFVPAGVDDAFFDELHDGVMAAVATAAVGAVPTVDSVRPRRVGMIAAAAVLFGLGFALGDALGGPAGFRHRAPVAVEGGNNVVVDPGVRGNVLPMSDEIPGYDEQDPAMLLHTLEQEYPANVPGLLPARVETRRSPLPEAGKAGKGKPDAGRPDAGKPDAGKPAASKPSRR
jgi:anti-sigma factor RsiW